MSAAGERRTLAVGDRIVGRPCVVTIALLAGPLAHGYCETCDDVHIIDRYRYDDGCGPWQPALAGSSGDVQ